MKRWKQKAIVQKIISYFPYSQKWNYFFQKYVTKAVNLTNEYFYDRLQHAKEHLDYFDKFSDKKKPEISLEIGTGWYPTIPISFFLAGVDKIYSVDISLLTSKERIKKTLEKFIEAHKNNTLADFIKVEKERFLILEQVCKNIDSLTLEDVLKEFKITYLIGDARKLPLADNSVDLINSNNTFEHIDIKILIAILNEFKRVIKKDGIMSHFIDMSDHFANIDVTISRYNFLQFSDKQWKWIDNTIQPQNRLRIYDYRKIYADLSIPISDEILIYGNIAELNLLKLDSKFETYNKTETAVLHCHLVSVL